jgi:hypothetical protein
MPTRPPARQMIDFTDILAPPVLTLIALIFCYLWAKGVRRGQPLTVFQKRLILYATIFMLGMSYTIIFHDQIGAALHLTQAWTGIVVAWAVLLVLIARRNYHKEHPRPWT